MKRSKWFISLLFALLIVLATSFSTTLEVQADETFGTVYSTNSGISVTLPDAYAAYAAWNQAGEDSTGWSRLGFSSVENMKNMLSQDKIELLTYRDDMDNSTGYEIRIASFTAPSDLTNDGILAAYTQTTQGAFGALEELPVYGSGTVTLNGLTFFKIYFETERSTHESLYIYILITKSGNAFGFIFDKHGDIDEGDYFDSLVSDIMTTATFSPELKADAEVLTGGSFCLYAGIHPGAFKDVNSDAGTATAASATASASSDSSSAAAAPAKKSLYKRFTSFEFPTWIILIALAALLLIGIKPSKKGEWQEEALSLANSKAVQGFCAVAIIIHHLTQDLMDKSGVLKYFSDLGVLFVGVFFFFSGYGLYTSLKTKENYLKGFLKKRLVTVLIPFYVCILVFVVNACICGESFSIPELLAAITGFVLINSHMWYIVEISILYLAFFIIYSLIKNRRTATIIMSAFVVLMTAGSLLLAHGADMSSRFWFMGEWWYNTTLCFILGIVISQNAEALRGFARKWYLILLPVFTGLTVGFYFLTRYALNTWSYWSEEPGISKGYFDKFRCLIIQLPWVIFFVITVLLIMMKVKFGNPVLKFLGSISLELYLIHNLFVAGLKDGSIMSVTSSSMYILLTILFAVGLATIISGFDKYIIGLIYKKRTDKALEPVSSERIHSIDVLRIVMAFLVVTIHVPFNGTTGQVFITYGKTAVPFFLVVCGFFLYRSDTASMMPRLKKQTLKMLIFYVGGNLLYVLAQFIECKAEGTTAVYTGKNFLDLALYNMSPFSEHLWFLGSLLYALVILMLLTKIKLLDYAMYAAPALIAAYVVLSHLNVAEPYVLRNAILVGLPYTMMGMLIRRYKDKLMKIKAPILWILGLVLCVTAIVELNTYKQGTGVPFVSCELLVYVIMLLCLKYPDFGKDTVAERMGVDLSLPIYILHILPVIFLWHLIPTTSGLMSTYGAITIFVITALISALYVWLKKLILKMKTA